MWLAAKLPNVGTHGSKAKLPGSKLSWYQYRRRTLDGEQQRKESKKGEGPWNEVDRRSEQQEDEEQARSGHTCKLLTEELAQDKFKDGFAALNNTATKMTKFWNRATRRLMRKCDGTKCSKKDVALTKQDLIEIVHTRREVAITVGWCRKCYSKKASKTEVSVSQFRTVRNSLYGGMSDIKKLSNSMFDHAVADTVSQIE